MKREERTGKADARASQFRINAPHGCFCRSAAARTPGFVSARSDRSDHASAMSLGVSAAGANLGPMIRDAGYYYSVDRVTWLFRPPSRAFAHPPDDNRATARSNHTLISPYLSIRPFLALVPCAHTRHTLRPSHNPPLEPHLPAIRSAICSCDCATLFSRITMSRSPSSSALLPLPGSPGSSWPMYRARLKALFHGADATVVVSFWLFGTSSPFA